MFFGRICALCALLVLLAASPAAAQILNTLSGFEERRGWQGEAGGYLRLSGGNTDVRDYAASAALQWEGGRNRVRAIADYSSTRSNGEDTSEELTGHLRHNYQLTTWLATLAFAQWQHNPFQDLDLRRLLGLGARFDLIRTEPRRLSIGVAAMHESERLVGAAQTETERLSAYLDFHRDLREYLRVAVVGWYQPDLGNFADLRASVLADLDVDLTGSLTLVLGSSYEYDSRPPAGIADADWGVRTGLRLSL